MEIIFIVLGAAVLGGLYGYMMVRAQQKDQERDE